MKLSKWIYLGLCYSCLVIGFMAEAAVSDRMIFRRTTIGIATTKTGQANIATVPRVACAPGHALDRRGKCRKVFDDW